MAWAVKDARSVGPESIWEALRWAGPKALTESFESIESSSSACQEAWIEIERCKGCLQHQYCTSHSEVPAGFKPYPFARFKAQACL